LAIQALEKRALINDEVWEINQDVGMMRVGFHPTTNKRRSTYITNFWSRFNNVHQEEALSRLGALLTGGRAGGRAGGTDGGREGSGREGGKEVELQTREDFGGACAPTARLP
jgi:hypothetical protein